MKTTYRPDLNAHVTTDDADRVRHIRHSQELWPSDESVARLSSHDYLGAMAGLLQIPGDELKNLHTSVSYLEPREQGVEYRQSEEKHLFDATTIGYCQTYMNVPVWRKGIAVQIKQNPNRIVSVTNNTEDGLRGTLPEAETVERYRTVFQRAAVQQMARRAGLRDEDGEERTAAFIRDLLNLKAPPVPRRGTGRSAARRRGETQLLSGKFFIYKYDPDRRYAGTPKPAAGSSNGKVSEEEAGPPIPELPPVSGTIQPGQAYLVGELIFTSSAPGFDGFVWLALVEVETGSVLYIECMTCGVNGLVFRLDPQVKTGDLTITSDDSTGDLNLQRDDVVLTNLDAPMSGTQQLKGTFVDIEELTADHADPDVDPPTKPSGDDFDYPARSNNFGAVNAYYHMTELFRKIEDLGFPIATYFDGTTFPIPVDFRGLGNEINAHWAPNGSGGTDHMCFALCDKTDTVNPLARAVDPWVHWHEMGGHGTLGDHVGGGQFGFAHSAGDGLAAIQMDPESQLRALGLPERFRYAPFRPFTKERRFDRAVADGWAWDGDKDINDDGNQYQREQILATCHFRIYRSIGGDHDNLGRRKFASRVVTYLILRTIGTLTSGTNPANAQIWCEALQAVDEENWTSEGLSGGAYNKVIRWAFEKQGEYQPDGAPSPVVTPGDPPEVDVYIDDGRGGEYPFQAVHWHNMSMWNRTSPDGLPGHQNAVEGATNYLYGKVKNRGTQAATNVTVRAYHSLPGAGLTWPGDFTEMSPGGGLPIASIGANNTQEVTVGPFEWVPNVNVYGHDCTLMIASTDGDPSNVDLFTGSETVAEWRLVPNDNNVGQRNVTIVPGGGGGEALVAALDGAVFYAGNSFNKLATMEIQVDLPRVLAAKGWRVLFPDLDGTRFRLKAGEKRKIRLQLATGQAFTPDEIKGATDRDVNVRLYGNGILLGGMTYRLDPDLRERSGGQRQRDVGRQDAAANLLERLNVSAGQRIEKVRVKRVSIDIDLTDDE
jgi:zinc metalloprotease ZmpB